MDAVSHYVQVFEALRQRKRWTTDVTYLRFSALTLAYADDGGLVPKLEGAAEVLKARAGWTSPLRSSLRYAVAALILKARLDPERTHQAVVDTREAFKTVKLSRSGIMATMAALILVLHEGGKRAPAPRIARMRAIYDAWKDARFWLTGQDDYVMAALHAATDRAVPEIAHRVEAIYERSRELGFSRGEGLQLASHILALRDTAPLDAARRFGAMRDALRAREFKAASRHYDEVALLTFASGDPSDIALATVTGTAQVREVRPRPSQDLAFSIATGLVLAHEGREQLGTGADVGAMQAAHAALAAQQAAMVACVAASVTAASAASAAAG